MARARLGRRHVRVGNEVHVGAAMRLASLARMMAPSIFASSDRRCGLNAASSRNPPEQMFSTSGPSPTTISAPLFACRMRSSPSRNGVPGETAPRAARSSGLRRYAWATAAWYRYAASRPSCSRRERHGLHRVAKRRHADELDARRWPRVMTRARPRGGSRGARLRPSAARSDRPAAAHRRGRPRRTRRRRSGSDGRTTRSRSRARARESPPGSVTWTPPATSEWTSCLSSLTPARCASTASTVDSRPASRPCAERRGIGACECATSACTSTSSGRWPSRTGATTEPGVPAVGRRGTAPTGRARRRGRCRSSRTDRDRRCRRTGASPHAGGAGRGGGRHRRRAPCRRGARAPAGRRSRRPW